MKIKCSKCGCEYKPGFMDANYCPVCGYGMLVNIKTESTSEDPNNKAI